MSRTVPPNTTSPEPELTREGGRVVGAATPALVPPVTSGSLAEIPFRNAEEAPAEVVISRKDDSGIWHDVTCAAFREEVLAVAKGLIASGVGPGDRVAIMARTTYAWTLLDFAAWAAGAITVPIYPISSASQAAWILEDSGATACVVENVEQARLITGIRGQLPALRELWQIDTGAISQLISAGWGTADTEVGRRKAAVGPQHIATLIYTSGTTGRPKGCVLTHGNFFAEVDNAVELLFPVFKSVSSEPASTLLFLPLSHVFGRMVAVGCLRARVRLGHAASIATEDLLADLAGFQPTFLLAIPYVLEKVYNTGRATAERMGRASSFDRAARIARRYGEVLTAQVADGGPPPPMKLRAAHALYDPLVYRRIRAALGGKVRYVICGGSPLGKRLAAFYAGAGVEVFEGYGLTETTAAATVTPPLKPRLGTVGRPLPGSAVRIADDGEVWLSGGQLFAGYWNGGELQPADRGGWFATGDIGELDDDGYLAITGRKKEILITSGGKNVAPAPLEDRIRAHPLVGQCMVVGDHRPYVAALITLDPDGLAHWRSVRKKETLSLEAITHDRDLLADLQRAVDEANSLVSRPESIRRFVVLAEEFTEDNGRLTPSMKLKRRVIAADFAKEIEGLYAQDAR
ncbi:long-chain fatty acid--CoA ligase [Streptomyces sp. RB6PN25]|uniref:Acyl-CoA synthetase n=1 Tax=Streptomyces humicola TaxID=2953240 RepID=A0ABT1PVS9_9ACTN|nr:long-chain fatty acid--CoA ligase [Streptomyces humicola]MCQ4081248.1 long-chain fatty acid--CoA ligase [Streptomyces humicola]